MRQIKPPNVGFCKVRRGLNKEVFLVTFQQLPECAIVANTSFQAHRRELSHSIGDSHNALALFGVAQDIFEYGFQLRGS
jgi:hypothetical protein